MIIICFSIVANAICVSLCVECGAAWRHCQTLLAYLEAALLGWCLRECDNGINTAQRQHTLGGSSLLLTRKDSGEAGGREHPINVLEVTKVKVNGGRKGWGRTCCSLAHIGPGGAAAGRNCKECSVLETERERWSEEELLLWIWLIVKDLQRVGGGERGRGGGGSGGGGGGGRVSRRRGTGRGRGRCTGGGCPFCKESSSERASEHSDFVYKKSAVERMNERGWLSTSREK